MRRAIASAGWIALGSLLLAACGTDKKVENVNIFPKDYRTEIVLLLQKSLQDPNVRDAFITEPVLGNGGKGPYFSCVRFNPRGANRVYTGSEDRIAYFFEGHLNQLVGATPEQCGKAPYAPFPEAQKLCMAKTCE